MTNKVEQGVLAGAICHLQPFVYSKCSFLSRLFGCTTYFPSCSPGYMELPPIFPCKSLCLDLYFKCIQLFQKVKSPWPKKLDCCEFKSANPCISPFPNTTSSTFTGPSPHSTLFNTEPGFSSSSLQSSLSPSTTVSTNLHHIAKRILLGRAGEDLQSH